MTPTALSDPLRQLTLVHGDAGFVVTVSASEGLGLRRAFVALRRATADVLWSVDLDGGRDAEIHIPFAVLVAAFEDAWPAHEGAAARGDPRRARLQRLQQRLRRVRRLRRRAGCRPTAAPARRC